MLPRSATQLQPACNPQTSTTTFASNHPHTAACASAGGTGDSGSRNVIAVEELASLSDNVSVYDAIERLRPQWLQPFRGVGGGSAALAEAWMDERRLGGLEEFRRYDLGRVTEIRYLPGRETMSRYGADSGVIMVYTGARER